MLYRDGLVLILDKPAGLPVHAGPGGGPHLEQCFDQLRFGLPNPPALAHRLDRDTSGCLVLGRHAKALRLLGRIFAEGRAHKTYWAVVRGAPPASSGLVTLPLRKLTLKAGWRMVVHGEGQHAETEYRVMGAAPGISWLELHPRTGRTHQIRVHLAELGCPIVGDPLYGVDPGRAPSGPLHLHARSIELPVKPDRPPIQATSPVPPHLLAALVACGFADDVAGDQAREGEEVSTGMPRPSAP